MSPNAGLLSIATSGPSYAITQRDAARAAAFIGIPSAMIGSFPAARRDAGTLGKLQPLVEKAALTAAINDAWLLAAVLTTAALLSFPFARKSDPARQS